MAKKDNVSNLLTGHLNKILKEKHSIPITVKGKEVVITKGEALMRQMVEGALGYIEIAEVCDKDGTVMETREIIHSSDGKLVKEVLDRVEGKAAITGVKDDDSMPSIADKITEQGILQLNKIAKKSSLKI